ncbi:caspase family protein [Streptomyces sp. NPDC001868]|uniref:caspase family protein n=1 Tax=Streptomyces sp. NPDC001868 TaxID=3154401 RepID=UPI003316D1D2
MTTTRHALIIANDRYDDQSLGKLRTSAQDAVSLAEVLGDPEVGDFDVEVLRNERVDAIRRGIERFFSGRTREDALMLYFLCHGLKGESGSLYFAARDSDPRLLEATALSAQFVRDYMFLTRAGRTVLFLDCWYGGAFSRGSSSVRAVGDVDVLESFAGEKLGAGRGWAVITASNSMEYAFEGTELTRTTASRPSVFTRAVVEGLTTGDADLDADGVVSLDELYDYVFDHVKQQDPNQTPGRTGNMQGDMYLAHTGPPKRRIASPAPPQPRPPAMPPPLTLPEPAPQPPQGNGERQPRRQDAPPRRWRRRRLRPPTADVPGEAELPARSRVRVGGDSAERQEPREAGVADEARSVNVLVARAGGEGAVFELAASTDYEVLLNIGLRLNASLLQEQEAVWPEELVPAGGVWLRATLLLDGMKGSLTVPFFLPSRGESFRCACEPGSGSGHARGCAPRRWVRFPVRTPEQPAIVRGELVIYYEAAAVVAVELEMPVAMPGAAPKASVVGRLSTTFNDLGKLARRTASLLVSSPSERVVVNGVGFLDNPFAIGAGAADTSALNAREALFDSHIEVRDGHLRSRYDTSFSKRSAAYEQDLRRLAREGAELYSRLFSNPRGDQTIAFSLPALLRHEAQLRDRPPLLQVVDDRFDEHAMLWSMVYDLPVGGDINRYQPCPAVREYGPESRDGPIPPVCPWGEQHRDRGDVLCPYGFWGLSCMVEQPPTVHRDLEAVVSRDPEEIALLAAVGGSLNEQLTTAHLGRLADGPPRCGLTTATGTEVANALGPEAMDIVYFYCHCGYDVRSDTAAADRYLDLGGVRMQPLDINMWARTVWDDPHWPRRRPLVVLNGCHTAETTSGTLNSFVPAFTLLAGASGVLGTEVTLEQGLAGWAMEELLARLLDGSSIGEALHGTRWAMLRRGNVMGLAYTAYCLANLTLRPPKASQE